ncbi:MAG: hypothetical protein M0D54_17060 [Hyphomonadaceae bacterium JAD_PAG50586_4]|nr:MAG: hypothetical protein M0D54_17060 [Hyphomonadaceae bacterium JAD_PAG50586_4]
MRPGVIVSIIAHIGAVWMTMLVWETRPALLPMAGAVVPVEIVDVAVESNVRARQEAEAQEQETAAQDETVPEEAETTPASASEPAPRPRDRNQDAFENLLNDPGLIDRSKDRARPRPNNGDIAENTRQGAGPGTAEFVALEDRARALARAHLRRCWRMPADLPDPDRLVVTVEFDLNRNGTLNGQPRVTNPRNSTFDPAMRTAVEAALRAVHTCDPFPFADDPVVGERYDVWRRQVYTFRPSL